MVKVSFKHFKITDATEIPKTEKHGKSKGKLKSRLVFPNLEKDERYNIYAKNFENKSDKPRKLGFIDSKRFVILKVEQPSRKRTGTVLVNINSLAKRFDLRQSDIKQQYHNGTLEGFLLDRIDELTDHLNLTEERKESAMKKGLGSQPIRRKSPRLKEGKISSKPIRRKDLEDVQIKEEDWSYPQTSRSVSSSSSSKNPVPSKPLPETPMAKKKARPNRKAPTLEEAQKSQALKKTHKSKSQASKKSKAPKRAKKGVGQRVKGLFDMSSKPEQSLNPPKRRAQRQDSNEKKKVT